MQKSFKIIISDVCQGIDVDVVFMYWLLDLIICLLIVLALSGCGPSIPNKDMGTVVYELPQVKGADKPFEMSELGPQLPEDESRPTSVIK
jgi:hypothetical protein